LAKQVILCKNLFSTKALDRIKTIAQEFEPENIFEITQIVKEFPKESCKDITAILDTLKLTKQYDKASQKLDIKSIDWDSG
jgi:hypothetical protein